MNQPENRETACCVVSCERPLDQQYWNDQYAARQTGWDLGRISDPIKNYIDQIQDKNISILIPGCGNAWEAEYLLTNGFKNVTVLDIAPLAVQLMRSRFEGKKGITIIEGDFFQHQGSYDLILEQTFFCALPPVMRRQYVQKMHQLLNQDGILAGVLFNRTFEKSPPFGGNSGEYADLFREAFQFLNFKACETSVPERAGAEWWIEFRKNDSVLIQRFSLEGITCSGCKNTSVAKVLEIPGVLHVTIGPEFTDMLVASKEKIAQATISGKLKEYKIVEI